MCRAANSTKCSCKDLEPNESGSLKAWGPPGPRVSRFSLHPTDLNYWIKGGERPNLTHTHTLSVAEPFWEPCKRAGGCAPKKLFLSLSLSRAKTHISPNPIPHHLTNIGCIYWLCSIPQQPLHFKTACSPTKGNVLFIWCLLTDHFHAQRKVKAQPGREDEMTAEILKWLLPLD